MIALLWQFAQEAPDIPALTVAEEQKLLHYPDGRTGCPDYVMEDSVPPQPYWPPL